MIALLWGAFVVAGGICAAAVTVGVWIMVKRTVENAIEVFFGW